MTLRRPAFALTTWTGGAALLLSATGWWIDRPMFFAAWLAAWWFCLGLVLGSVANGCIHTLSGGRWGLALAPAHRSLQQCMPWMLLLFVPLLGGMHVLYPWLAPPQAWTASLTHPAFEQAWFAPLFVAGRLAAYGFVWWSMARRGQPATSGRAAVTLIVYMVLTSLASVDLVMSLVTGWTSSVFGWLTLTGQMTSAMAAATGVAAMQGRVAATRPTPGQEPVWRDLGNLMLMFVMLQAYLQFMQFLIIWAENLPQEISWYLPRLNTGWRWVGLALVLLQFAAPLLALLWRRIKDEPRRLAWVAAGLVVMQALDAAWLIVPSVQPQGLAAWWLLPLTFAGMVLLMFGHLWPGPSVTAIGTRWEPANGRC